jgi:hypothetical protein
MDSCQDAPPEGIEAWRSRYSAQNMLKSVASRGRAQELLKTVNRFLKPSETMRGTMNQTLVDKLILLKSGIDTGDGPFLSACTSAVGSCSPFLWGMALAIDALDEEVRKDYDLQNALLAVLIEPYVTNHSKTSLTEARKRKPSEVFSLAGTFSKALSLHPLDPSSTEKHDILTHSSILLPAGDKQIREFCVKGMPSALNAALKVVLSGPTGDSSAPYSSAYETAYKAVGEEPKAEAHKRLQWIFRKADEYVRTNVNFPDALLAVLTDNVDGYTPSLNNSTLDTSDKPVSSSNDIPTEIGGEKEQATVKNPTGPHDPES